jgi:hypothetical protein
MKTTDIQMRPIRHFHEAPVRGHIFACFLAYRLVWELRQRWPNFRNKPRRLQLTPYFSAEAFKRSSLQTEGFCRELGRSGLEPGRRLRRQRKLEVMQKQLLIRLRLRVAGHHQPPPVGRRKADIQHLNGG